MLIVATHNDESTHADMHDRYAARIFNGQQFATLCVDLITHDEKKDSELRELQFDPLLLAGRLDRIAEWVRAQPDLKELKVGYFCTSTVGGAALVAAAQHPGYVTAVVCYGGRPDLAGAFLNKVKAPTLLLAGENDTIAIELNRRSLAHLNKQSGLTVIPGATHSFEEPGALEEMVRKALSWFQKHAATPPEGHRKALYA
jgi:dienelactone hydrolase